MKYYPLLYRLHAQERYLLWISNEHDSVAVDAEGFIPSFRDLTVLRQFAAMNRYSLESEEPVLHDLDWVVTYTTGQAVPVDCVEALTAWNLFGDIAVSIQGHGMTFRKLKSQHFEIYDKLFWGNNLPAVTPEGRQYIPQWSPDELKSLAQILTAGLGLFVSCTRTWPPSLISPY
jgi:hypothetical protein